MSILLFLSLITGSMSVIISCYYTYANPSIDVLDADLCTHYLLIGTTRLDEDGHLLLPDEFPRFSMLIVPESCDFDPKIDSIGGDFARLKTRNPEAKLMLSVTTSNPNWSTLVSSPLTMDRFASDSIEYFQKHGLDGIDLDWEFPTWSWDSKRSDRDRLTELLKTLRQSYGDKYLLSMATSGPPTITRKAYDVEGLNKYCDFVNVMNYDFHVYSWTNPVVGFNAPLRPMSREYSVIGEMNSDSSMAAYLAMGLARNKTVFGIPVYNLGFRLVNYFWSWPYAPAEGEVNTHGFYIHTCNITKTKHGKVTYKEYWNNKAASPYIVGTDKLWLTSENPRSVAAKANFARDLGCAGIMLFQIQTDDWRGDCGEGKYPLINSAKRAFTNRFR